MERAPLSRNDEFTHVQCSKNTQPNVNVKAQNVVRVGQVLQASSLEDFTLWTVSLHRPAQRLEDFTMALFKLRRLSISMAPMPP